MNPNQPITPPVPPYLCGAVLIHAVNWGRLEDVATGSPSDALPAGQGLIGPTLEDRADTLTFLYSFVLLPTSFFSPPAPSDLFPFLHVG